MRTLDRDVCSRTDFRPSPGPVGCELPKIKCSLFILDKLRRPVKSILAWRFQMCSRRSAQLPSTHEPERFSPAHIFRLENGPPRGRRCQRRCLFVTGRVIRQELRPLDELASAIERIGAANLADRVRLSGCPAELAPVVACLNQLLGRLDAALTREKSFAADVAHELRTPLAGLVTTLEDCSSRPCDSREYQAALANCLGIARGLQGLIENLLQLARADAGRYTLNPEPADIDPLVRDCWSPFKERAAERNLRLEWDLDGTPRGAVDQEAARQVLNNLFDNAVTYADAGGQIRISLLDEGARVRLTVANSGCVLAPGETARVFDRFWRGDSSRSATGQHCGLGLSLCKKLVERQGGTIRAEIRKGWFFVSLTLPATPGQVARALPP